MITKSSELDRTVEVGGNTLHFIRVFRRLIIDKFQHPHMIIVLIQAESETARSSKTWFNADQSPPLAGKPASPTLSNQSVTKVAIGQPDYDSLRCSHRKEKAEPGSAPTVAVLEEFSDRYYPASLGCLHDVSCRLKISLTAEPETITRSDPRDFLLSCRKSLLEQAFENVVLRVPFDYSSFLQHESITFRSFQNYVVPRKFDLAIPFPRLLDCWSQCIMPPNYVTPTDYSLLVILYNKTLQHVPFGNMTVYGLSLFISK